MRTFLYKSFLNPLRMSKKSPKGKYGD